MCHDTFSGRQGVEDDSMNVLCLGARVIGPELATEVVKAYLAAKFFVGAERHQRRLGKVQANRSRRTRRQIRRKQMTNDQIPMTKRLIASPHWSLVLGHWSF